MTRFFRIILLSAFLALPVTLPAQEPSRASSVPLPTSKTLTIPAPGRIGSTNSFPATIAISPDGRYAALLNNGYGTQETLATQSIAVLDLKTNQLSDYPDKRFGEEVHQSYFLGLVFGSDGKHLYASVGSITDPTGEKPGDTGNGIAVYSFAEGKVAPERFIAIEPQPLAAGKKVAIALQKTPPGTAIPYPAGLALVSARGDSDNTIVFSWPTISPITSCCSMSRAAKCSSASISAQAIWSRLHTPTPAWSHAMAAAPGAACGMHPDR